MADGAAAGTVRGMRCGGGTRSGWPQDSWRLLELHARGRRGGGYPAAMLALLAAVCTLPLPWPQALAAGDPTADLEMLVAYEPTRSAPTDPAIVAATERLLHAMPAIVREPGELARRLAALHAARGDATVPSAAQPIRAADPLLRVLVRFDDERMQLQPLDWLGPHRAAAAFPGAVPAAALPVSCGRIVDLGVPGWHSL